ncbi:MAG TPA: PspC domain-containing protein [Solirubrobacteraceae bacterium]|nr:PspC domain-containing protein [Solirubrobacteraceae bacterium]
MTAFNERPGPGAGLSRGNEGRWLGGVCAGVAPVIRMRAGWMRAAFVAAALIAGLGIALYLACWLIIPAEGDRDGDPGPRDAVVLARACGGCAALAVLALVGAAAAVFGFGWLVVGLGAIVLIGVLVWWPRLGPAWALLPVAALTLPAIAVAASGVRLTTQLGATTVAPRTYRDVSATTYRSGLNTMLVDLRRTTFPASGTLSLHIAAGMRRTIVALPAGRCVRVVVQYDVNPFAARLTGLLAGRTHPLFSDLVLYGRVFGDGRQTGPASKPGPLLDIDFSSQGGSLYVRDYPATVDPDAQPDWPGYMVDVEARPNTHGMTRAAAKARLASWRVRRAAQIANARAVDALMPGPCGTPVTDGTIPRRTGRTASEPARRPARQAARPRGRRA